MKDNVSLINFSINKNVHLKDKIKFLIKCLFLLYLFSFLSHFLSNLIQEFFFNLNVNELLLKQQNKDAFKDSIFFNVFYLLVLGPLIEELIFRLPLNFKKRSLFLSILLICFFFIGANYKILSIYNIQTWIKITSILLVLFIFKYIRQEKIDEFKLKFEGFVFYLFAISFGLLHITNFYHILPEKIKLFSFLFVLPQIFLGIFIGYVRLKNGFGWGLIMHLIFNLPTILIYLFNIF